jgi:uncharacterized membrane protein HdeD (DUF308 family)
VDRSTSLLYRRSAAGCLAVGVIVLIVGIILYGDHHPTKGLAALIIGALLVVVGIVVASVERRSRRGRPW